MRKSIAYAASTGLSAILLCACGGGSDTCDPTAQSGCDGAQVCEEVQGGDPACFDPVVVSGRTFDLADQTGVSDARVVALDANQSPVSSVAVTGDDGSYQLTVPATRQADGTPIGFDITLRADAAGYQTFPGGLRQAQPVDTSVAARDGDSGSWVVKTAATDVGLIGLEDGAGTASIHGTVNVPDSHAGVLVVADSGGTGVSAIADRSGDYEIFNLAPGDYTVQAYARGVNYDPASLTLAGADDAQVNLSLNDTPASTLNGQVDIVDPGQGKGTSVILVVASTFNPALARGDSPPGFRAPDPGTAPDVSGAFSIDGIPDGTYVALAAFEDDYLVRDPDTCIAGTDFVQVTVGGADVVSMDQAFKVTGSLDLISPGAEGPEAVAGPPTFTWKDDSSEDEYDLSVVDAYGNQVWSKTIPGSSGQNPTVTYDGPLDPGMYYQVRVVDRRSSGSNSCEISQSEDLKGVFYLQ